MNWGEFIGITRSIKSQGFGQCSGYRIIKNLAPSYNSANAGRRALGCIGWMVVLNNNVIAVV